MEVILQMIVNRSLALLTLGVSDTGKGGSVLRLLMKKILIANIGT